jgi:hypothetical protein
MRIEGIKGKVAKAAKAEVAGAVMRHSSMALAERCYRSYRGKIRK